MKPILEYYTNRKGESNEESMKMMIKRIKEMTLIKTRIKRPIKIKSNKVSKRKRRRRRRKQFTERITHQR
jgi:hypothetical protein